MDDRSCFRQKVVAEKKAWVDSHCLNEYLVGILYGDKTSQDADVKGDIMWTEQSGQTTVGRIEQIYEENVPLPGNVALRHRDSVIESTKTMVELNFYGDNIILLEAFCKLDLPSLDRSLHELRSNNDGMILDSRVSDANSHSQTISQILDREKVMELIDQIILSDVSLSTSPETTKFTPQEFLAMVTMINFYHEKLCPLFWKHFSEPNASAVADEQVHVLREWQGLAMESYEMYQNRAILFMDTLSMREKLFERELRRYIDETAGFYSWLFLEKYLRPIWLEDLGTDTAFTDARNEWRNLNHCTIAYWVDRGKDLRYTPTSISSTRQPTQLTIDRTNKSEKNVVPELSLLKIFSGCTTEILEASVNLGVNLLEQLKEPLRQLSPDIDAVDWLKNTEKLQKLSLPPKTIVGVVGNTGAGKSSVINAMLDEERLVPTNCMRACTAVVTEISYNHHKIPYRAEVDFISEKEWEKELHILFKDLLDANGNVSYEACKQDTEASIAYAKIRAVYPEYTNDMLQKSSVAQLLKQPNVQKLLGAKRDIIESDAAQLYQKLQAYVDSKEKANGEKGLEVWPLIKVVRIYVKAASLSTGAVIVDLPGVHDSNAARAAVAEGYMKQCTGLWIVAPITRAVDDKAAKSLLGGTFKRQLKMDGGLDSVTFTCSKTDDISISECQESLGLETQMSALWTEFNEFNKAKERCKERLGALKETKAKKIATLDQIDEQIETWERLKNNIEHGNRVFAPDKSSGGKRRRDKNSNASGSPQKKQRQSSSDSEDEMTDAGSGSDVDELDEHEDDEADNLMQPLTLEAVEKRLTELKENKKKSRLHRQEIDAEMKLARREISDMKGQEANAKAEICATAISARNEYSRCAIQQDFAAGIKELDHELAEEADPSDFDPEINIRDYDKVARSLPVFCVSSRAYQKLQGRFKKEANVPGFQDIDATEIPGLQAHCMKLTEASRIKNCQRFLNGMNQFLNSLRLTLSPEGIQVTAEQKVARAAIVEGEYKAFDKELENRIETTRKDIAEAIDAKVMRICDRAVGIAREQANKTVHRWNNHVDSATGGYRWATYKALCRRNGVFWNRHGHHDWNAELIEPVMKAVTHNWARLFSRNLFDVLKLTAKESASLLESFHNNVSIKISKDIGPSESFHMLSQQIPLYQQILADIFNGQILEIKQISKDISRMFQPVIAEALSPVYEVCVQENGNGSFFRMKMAMSTFVNEARDTMFHESVDVVRKALKELCKSMEEELLSQIRTVMISVKRDYMSAVHRGVVSKEKQDILKGIMKTITESESSFKKLAARETQEEVPSVPANNEERQIKCEEDLSSSQAKDNESPWLTSAFDGPVRNEEGNDVSEEYQR